MTEPALTAVLVGRPNVGKSTLFNRLCQNRRAITSAQAGTTRDWMEGSCHWNGQVYRVIDTGGYAPGDDVMASVRAQVERWLKAADVVLWLVDAGDGLTPADQKFARLLRPLSKRVLLVVNKADHAGQDAMLGDFARLGLPQVLTLSATHGRRITGLLEALEERAEKPTENSLSDEDPGLVRVAIVGRPNVGKSSLLNRLVGEERVIVSPVAGTTRDTIDTRLKWKDREFLFIDTAGLRAKKSKAGELEGLTRLMTERAVDRCEVALLLVDAEEGVTDGDGAVGLVIDEKRRACVVAVNKWDRVGDPSAGAAHFRQRFPDAMPFLAHSPLVLISAKTGHHVEDLLGTLAAVRDDYGRRFEDDELTAFFWKAVQEHPFTVQGRKLTFYLASQVAVSPPVMILRTNLPPADVHFSYQRHLEKLFRQTHGLAGVPLVLKFKRGKR